MCDFVNELGKDIINHNSILKSESESDSTTFMCTSDMDDMESDEHCSDSGDNNENNDDETNDSENNDDENNDNINKKDSEQIEHILNKPPDETPKIVTPHVNAQHFEIELDKTSPIAFVGMPSKPILNNEQKSVLNNEQDNNMPQNTIIAKQNMVVPTTTNNLVKPVIQKINKRKKPQITPPNATHVLPLDAKTCEKQIQQLNYTKEKKITPHIKTNPSTKVDQSITCTTPRHVHFNETNNVNASKMLALCAPFARISGIDLPMQTIYFFTMMLCIGIFIYRYDAM